MEANDNNKIPHRIVEITERDYGLEISAKAVELSNELLQIMQQVPKESISKIITIGNEIKNIVAEARKKVIKIGYQVYIGEADHSQDNAYLNKDNAEKRVKLLQEDGFKRAYYQEIEFLD